MDNTENVDVELTASNFIISSLIPRQFLTILCSVSSNIRSSGLEGPIPAILQLPAKSYSLIIKGTASVLVVHETSIINKNIQLSPSDL